MLTPFTRTLSEPCWQLCNLSTPISYSKESEDIIDFLFSTFENRVKRGMETFYKTVISEIRVE